MAFDDLNEFHAADCITLIKAFERGATYSNTPEAASSLLSVILDGHRTQSQGLMDQIDNEQERKNKRAEKTNEPVIDGDNLNSPTGAQPSLIEDHSKSKKKSTIEKIFNNECIPCGDRINLKDELDFKIGLKSYWDLWKGYLEQHIQQLLDMLDMLKWENQYFDLCALISFFKNFVCIPDIARIISVLMALLSRVNFQFGGVFDLVISLFGPLLQPFLSNFVNLLIQYLMLIVAPIECLINAIQAQISKLDYNSFFQNIDNIQWHLSIGPNMGPVTQTLPITGQPLHAGPRFIDQKFSPAQESGIVLLKLQEKVRVDEAARKLRELENTKVASTDTSAIIAYNKKLEAAQQEYEAAVDNRDLSAVGRINKQITKYTSQAKSALMMLIGMLRNAIDAVSAYVRQIFEEFQKLMGDWLGGSGNFMKLIADKLAIAQMVGFITALLKAISEFDLHCNDDVQDIKVERLLSGNTNALIYTDDEGNTHIEESEASVNNFIDAVLDAIGQQPSSTLASKNNPYGKRPYRPNNKNNPTGENFSPNESSDPTIGLNRTSNTGATGISGQNNVRLVNEANNLNNNGNNIAPINSIGNNVATKLDKSQPTGLSAKQKLRSLINYTGDPVVDSSIARGINSLTTPVKVSFKCPLKTTVADAEQVNKWIRELNMA